MLIFFRSNQASELVRWNIFENELFRFTNKSLICYSPQMIVTKNSILFLLVFPFFANAQNNTRKAPWIFSFDIGTDKSLGKRQLSYKSGVVNTNLSISYPSHGIYEKAALRLRLNGKYTASRNFHAGLQSGINCHINEQHMGQEVSFVTVPVQLTINQRLFELLKTTVFFDGAGGVNIFGLYEEMITEKGGFLFSTGLLFHLARRLIIRTGYEHQIDNGVINIPDDPFNNLKKETVYYKQKRDQIYIGVGMRFK
jgi:hypothetical protein